ncbi:baseplate J/gp47 family protein [Chromohalobacter sp. 296-RDG]|uniref:baseplate J/gp47 family protein n=1 Tax=Chromohalobacter sp. 296-RDG TaxID=2994062 RepID=UPI0024690E72|nr:baseplate J/gp47 family protein [Chromohalobacter sp. 296-RDG]
MSSPIDLSQLPSPVVVEELDFETILAERRARLLELTPDDKRADVEATLDLESEPLTKLLEENAYRELTWRQRVNEAARAVMLAYSNDEDLDQLAANYNVERLIVDQGDPDATPPVPPTYEGNTELRMRAQRAWEGLSVAGPTKAYEFHALSADGRVADASAKSPEPCDALVTILARDGNGEASQDLLDIVDAALSAEDIRPVGDRLTVQSADIVDYEIDAALELEDGPEKGPILEAAEDRLADYKSEQRRLGRSIRRSAIYAVLHVEGVRNVTLNQPESDVVLDRTQAGHCIGSTVTADGGDDG